MALKKSQLGGPWEKFYILIFLKKWTGTVFLPGLNIVSQGCNAWSWGYHLGMWGESKKITDKQIFILDITNPRILYFKTFFYMQ